MNLFKMIFKRNNSEPIEFKQLIDTKIGCIASDKITIELLKVGYMYREEPFEKGKPDSGWRFLSGDEDEVYMENTGNHRVHLLNSICNYDQEIIPLLDAVPGSAFIRGRNGKLQLDIGDEELVPPEKIDGANVLYYLTTNQVSNLGYCTDLETMYKQFYAAVVIAHYEADNLYYIFLCDSNYETIIDWDCNTLEEAKSFKEFNKQHEWIKRV